MKPQISLSVDVEYLNFPALFGFSAYENREYGNAGCLNAIELFKKAGIKSTFFVCADFAGQFPKTIQKIVESGHELASHSLSHRRFSVLSKQQQEFEITESKKFLEKEFGVTVKGFRAPGNQPAQNHFELLSKAGYKYDSSIHPALLPHRPQDMFKPKKIFEQNGIAEIPISTLAGIPISWIWMRNSNAWLTKAGTRYNQALNRPTVIYLHSWEFEPLPVLSQMPKAATRKTGKEFSQMVSDFISNYQKKGFGFTTLEEIAREHFNRHSGFQ